MFDCEVEKGIEVKIGGETGIAVLLAMLTYKRPAFSRTDEEFLDRFFRPLKDHPNVTQYDEDNAGNLIFQVGGGGKTLFCAHSDTVHRTEGRQKPRLSGGKVFAQAAPPAPRLESGPVEALRVLGNAYVSPKALQPASKPNGKPWTDFGECLGADDGAGCWIVREIILSGVPCTCIITRGEEKGGVGSKALAKENEDFLRQFNRAVAFDRRGTSSVITHQGWGNRCCSDEFAEALSAALSEGDLIFAPDNTGVYTDTAEWVDIIPECTNISVGYFSEHSNSEHLDLKFVQMLRDTVITVDWAALPVVRDPDAVDVRVPEDLLDVPFDAAVAWVESNPEKALEMILDSCSCGNTAVDFKFEREVVEVEDDGTLDPWERSSLRNKTGMW